MAIEDPGCKNCEKVKNQDEEVKEEQDNIFEIDPKFSIMDLTMALEEDEELQK